MVVSKKIIYALMFFICINSYAENEKKLLVDEAGILQHEVFVRIEKLLETVSEKSKSDAVIVIVSETEEKSPQNYADDYFDYNNYGQGDEKEGSLLLIITGDGSKGSRYAHISTHGKQTIKAINDRAIEKLLDSLIDGGLKKNDYPRGIESYISSLSRRFYNTLSLFEITISLGVALLFFLIKYRGTVRKYAFKGNFVSAPFYDIDKNSIVSLSKNNDSFLHSDTTSRVIQSNGNKGSNDSTTHKSSSGRTHGGGGRSF